MATREQRKSLRAEVNGLLAAAVNLSAEDFARPELGEHLSFEELVPDFELMIAPLQDLAGRKLDQLSFQQLERIKKAAQILSERTTEIREFNIATLQGAPMEARNQIVQRTQEAPDQVLELLSVPLALTGSQAADLSAIASEASAYRDQIEDAVDRAQKEIKQYQSDASTALTAIKTIAGEAGVAEHAGHFDTASSSYADAAKKWLMATIGTAGTTLVVAIAFLVTSFIWSPTGVPQAIQYGIAKLIVLSVLSFATIWTARNYRSSKHNELVNRHRRDALGTFRAFVEASEDPQIRDAILLQASQAVFTGRPTGYDSPEPGQIMTVPMFDTVKRMADGGGEG